MTYAVGEFEMDTDLFMIECFLDKAFVITNEYDEEAEPLIDFLTSQNIDYCYGIKVDIDNPYFDISSQEIVFAVKNADTSKDIVLAHLDLVDFWNYVIQGYSPFETYGFETRFGVPRFTESDILLTFAAGTHPPENWAKTPKAFLEWDELRDNPDNKMPEIDSENEAETVSAPTNRR